MKCTLLSSTFRKIPFSSPSPLFLLPMVDLYPHSPSPLSPRRYTESMMNTYQSMGVPPSASSFAQFYQAANAVSAASAAAIGVGVDSLGNACTQPSSAVVSTAGGGQAITDIPRYPWMTLSGRSRSSMRLIVASLVHQISG